MRVEASPLLSFVAQLGVPIDAIVAIEGPTRLAGSVTVTGEAVRGALTGDALATLGSAYGDALRIGFQTGEYEEFGFRGGGAIPDVTPFLALAGNTANFEFVLDVDKQRLVRKIVAGEPTCPTVLYFTPAALLAALGQDLPSLEQMWSDPTKRLLLVALDEDLLVQGVSLSVIGGVHQDRAVVEMARPSLDVKFQERVGRRRADCIGWEGQLETRLTPWHFYAAEHGASEVERALDSRLTELAILFTCDRARVVSRPDSAVGTRAEFRGQEYTAFVPIPQGPAVIELSGEQREGLRALLDWTYQSWSDEADASDWVADRLPFVQLLVAHGLEPRPEESRFAAFAQTAPEVFQGAQWQWRAFLEGRVAKYLDKVQQLESMVADTVEQYAQRSAELSKGLTDAMLAAVAALIGSFIAAAFSKPFNATLFQISVLTYALYVAVFPGCLGVLSNSGQAKHVRETFEARRRRFDTALFGDKVDEIVGARVIDANDRYDSWRTGIVIGYAAIVVTTVIAALAIPGNVSAGSSVPAPSATTTTAGPSSAPVGAVHPVEGTDTGTHTAIRQPTREPYQARW